MMKIEWQKQILANNLKMFRNNFKYTQRALAKKTGISLRLIQDLEAGTGNPTIETIFLFAKFFGVEVPSLLMLNYLMIDCDPTIFLQSFKKEMESVSSGVVLRTPSGVFVWGNKNAFLLNGRSFSNSYPADVDSRIPPDFQESFRGQLQAEQSGFTPSYFITLNRKSDQRQITLRCRPTLVIFSGDKVPFYTSVYVTDDQKDPYYLHYCKMLLSVA
jgi:DNA-binding XRE family transcriptional regulator